MLQRGIYFNFLTERFHFPNRTSLKHFLLGQLRKEGRKVDAIHYVFCTDDYLHQMNLRYLDHDTYTDIITFPLSKKTEPLTADIYISIDRVRDNAQNRDIRFLNELHRVIFHGALHLCGYRDKKVKEQQTMRKKEDEWLDRYFRST